MGYLPTRQRRYEMKQLFAVALVFVFITVGLLVFFGHGADVLDAINTVVSYVTSALRQVGAL
jgi:uncharacterized protein YjeT (DUF2065 family)